MAREQLRSVAQESVSAVDLVTSEIRRAVLTGALPAGQEFSIRELASQLGVSHIPIREALRRLETQGLVVLRQAKCATVAPLAVSDLEAIYRLRSLVEVPLAAAAVGHHSTTHIHTLERLLQDLGDPDPENAWQAHYDFHAALLQPAVTPWDERILQTLWTAAERYTHLVFDPTRISDAERSRRIDTHRSLLDAALGDNPAAMTQALTEHLRANEHRIREHITHIESLTEGTPHD